MEDFVKTTGRGRLQKADREVFREVLAALRRSEVRRSELQGRCRARAREGRRSSSEREALVSDAELRGARAQLAQVQRLSHTGCFSTTLEAEEHVWSDELYRILEIEPGVKVRPQTLATLVHQDDLPACQAGLESSLVDGADFDQVFRVITPKGTAKHVHAISQWVEWPGGAPVIIGSIQDLTESRTREAELLLANRYLTIAQRLSKTGSFTWDLRQNERRWSEEMYRIFEVDSDGPLAAAEANQVIHPDDMGIFESLVSRAREGKDFDAELRLITRGALKHVHVVGNLIGETRERPVFVGAVQDVTDRKRAEEELVRARSELAHVARATALSALTASIAHEVNQPLAGIIANASACLRMLAADPPNLDGAQVTAQRTIRDGNRASEVITRLRALFARRPAAQERVDLNDAAREILLLSSSELQSGKVVLQTDFASDLPAVVGDRVQLQQVILNLVLNAVQAMRGVDERSHDLQLSTGVRGRDEVTLSVRDTGLGAPAENLEELFSAFYSTKPEGMGVGLSISRSIIEAHGGQIWASANDGPGLTVSFSIPSATSPAHGER